MDMVALEDWKARLPNLCKGYAARDIFNMYETGVFFRQLPSKTLSEKKSKCSGGKLSKDRLTCLLSCNMAGEKLIIMMIGRAANPRAFRQANIKPKDLPVLWRYNSKAWMTANLFIEWLNIINRVMEAANRNILMFLDNAFSHPHVILSNISLVFFPQI